jgi:hypothetical protein
MIVAAQSAPARDQAAADRAALDWLLASDEPGIRMLARRDLLSEGAADEALTILRDRQQPDGTWHVGGRPYWRRSAIGPYWDPADWPRSGPSLMLTLNALRVLRAANC